MVGEEGEERESADGEEDECEQGDGGFEEGAALANVGGGVGGGEVAAGEDGEDEGSEGGEVDYAGGEGVEDGGVLVLVGEGEVLLDAEGEAREGADEGDEPDTGGDDARFDEAFGWVADGGDARGGAEETEDAQ